MKLSLTTDAFLGLPAWAVVRLCRWLGVACSETTIHSVRHPGPLAWACKGMTLGLHMPNLGNMGYDFSSADAAPLEEDIRRIDACPVRLSYALFHPPQADNSHDGFQRLLQRLERVRHPLVMENIPTLSLAEFTQLHQEVSARLKRPVGVCLDIPHALLAGEDWPAYWQQFGHDIKVIHLSDLKPPEDSHQPFGLGGVLNLAEIIKFLMDAGFQGTLNFEIKPRGADGFKALAATWSAAHKLAGTPLPVSQLRRWAWLAGWLGRVRA